MNKNTTRFNGSTLQIIFISLVLASFLGSIVVTLMNITTQLQYNMNLSAYGYIVTGTVFPLLAFMTAYFLHTGSKRLTKFFDATLMAVLLSTVQIIISMTTSPLYQLSFLNNGSYVNYFTYEVALSTATYLGLVSLLVKLRRDERW